MTSIKWLSLLTLCGGIIYFLLQWGQAKGAKLIYEDEIDFDYTILANLNSYKDYNPEDIFAKNWAIIVYISKLSCSSCVAREVAHLNAMHAEYGEANFMMVVHGWDEVYLRNMVRVGKVQVASSRGEGTLAACHLRWLVPSLVDGRRRGG